MKQLDALPSDPSAAAAIRSLLGESEVGTSAEEIGWAFRKLLEEQAPLVVVFDDIQWGEQTFLDLIEHVALLSAAAPILLLCMARPELLEVRPTWPVTARLEPLTREDAERLIGEALPEALRSKIAAAAAGNPLFVSEMLSMSQEAREGGEVAVPATLRALLAARLDQLDPAERRVLERGAVEGEIFHRGAVQALTPEETHVTPRLASLVRRQLIRSDRAQLIGEDGFRFRHLLVRDAAYDALPKTTRAGLHERFAGWIAEHAGDLVELDEVVGYHLEQAHRYLNELGLPSDRTIEIGERAAERLSSAGRRAGRRGDVRAVTNLLARAIDLYPEGEPRRLELLPALGRVLFSEGRWDEADAILLEAIEAGNETGDRRLAADASVTRTEIQLHRDSNLSHQQIRDGLADATRIFSEVGDEAALARALGFAGRLRFWSGDATGAIADLSAAAEHARAANDHLEDDALVGYIVLAIVNGPTSVTEGLRRCGQLRDASGGNRRRESIIVRGEARFAAFQGNFELARELTALAVALMKDLGLETTSAGVQYEAADTELLAGDPAAAERLIRPAAEGLLEIGDYGHYATFGPLHADALVLLDRDEEATEIIDLVAEKAIDDDLDAQIAWRRVRARLLARRNDYTGAERIAREGVERAKRTDFIDARARAHEALADVLTAAGRPEEALAEIRQAEDLYKQKENIVGAAGARARYAELQSFQTHS